MTDANASLMWIIWYRTLQGALEAAPTLLCGLLVAGLIRGIIGPAAVRRWFTDDPRTGPVRAWLMGILLPVCSLGVLPIAWELRRAGVPRATVLTFLLTAPLADPFSLTYAFQKLEAQGIWGLAALLFLLVGSFIVLVGIGVLLGRWMPEKVAPPELPRLAGSEFSRIGVAGLTAARGLSGRLLPFFIAGLVGSGLLALEAGGAFERAVNDESWTGPPRLAIVSIAFYVPPAEGTAIACDLLMSGESVRKVFQFFLLGLGFNLGTVAWIAWSYGWRLFVCSMVVVVGAALAVGYTASRSPANVMAQANEPHHFLEIESGGTVKTARQRALRTTVTNELGQKQWFLIGACGAVAGLALVGLFARALGDIGTTDYWMTRGATRPAAGNAPPWSKRLSGPQLALAAMAVALVTALAGLYVYYPAPAELLNQMDDVQMELAQTLKSDPVSQPSALRLLDQWQKLQQKLVVADLLRGIQFGGPLRSASDELGLALDRLSLALVERRTAEELQPLYRDARQAATRCGEVLDQRGSP